MLEPGLVAFSSVEIERPHLVQDGGRFVEELAHEGRIHVPAGQPEHVVHAFRGLAVVEVLGEVLVHLLLEPVDVLVESVVGDELRHLRERRHLVGVEVHLLEVGVEVAVERDDLAVGRLPGDVDDVAGVREALAHRVGHDPVELAPAGIEGDLVPAQDGLRAVVGIQDLLAGLDLGSLPGHRTALADPLAADEPVFGVAAELRLEELEGRPGEMRQHVIAHEPCHDAAGLLARGGLDVDALEEVGVARKALDLGLRRRARQREGALAALAGDLHDLADLAESFQVARAEVEHRGAMAEGAADLVVDDIVALALGGHRGQPFQALGLVDLDAEAPRGFDELGEFGVVSASRAPLMCAQSEACRASTSAFMAWNSLAWSRASPSALCDRCTPPR